MQKLALARFVNAHQWAVEATVGEDGSPQAAVIGVAATDDFELVFDTSTRSRKAENLRRTKRIAIVVGWDEGETVQLEGTVDEPTGDERARLVAAYVAKFADGEDRAKDDDITHFRIRPTWARHSDYRGAVVKIEETRYDDPA